MENKDKSLAQFEQMINLFCTNTDQILAGTSNNHLSDFQAVLDAAEDVDYDQFVVKKKIKMEKKTVDESPILRLQECSRLSTYEQFPEQLFQVEDENKQEFLRLILNRIEEAKLLRQRFM